MAQAHRNEARKWLNHCLLVDEHVAARLRLLEDVARAARRWVEVTPKEQRGHAYGVTKDRLARLEAEGSR